MSKEFGNHLGRRDVLKLAGLGIVALGTESSKPPIRARGRIYWSGSQTEKDIFFTIDDGWNADNMQSAFRTAEKYAIPLTFFPAGQAVKGNEELYKEIHDRGHTIENHTFTHTPFVADTTEKEILREIKDQQEAINDAIGAKIDQRFFRPPGGNGILWDGRGRILKKPYRNIITAAQKAGLDIAMWTIDSEGWEKGSTATSALRAVTKELPEHGRGGIVLTHAVASDIVAFPKMIEEAKKRGLKPQSMRKIR